MLTKEIENKVLELWDKFWAGGISNPLNAIEQITYLLFIKQLDEIDKTKDKNKSIFKGNFLRPNSKNENDTVDKEILRWSFFSRMPSDEMLVHIQTLVFPFIKTLGAKESIFAKHMNNAVFLIPKSSLLSEAVKTIDEVFNELKTQNRYIDAQGDFYELLLKKLNSAGKNGQFRTPTHIIEMIVELVQPDIHKKIADPACGSSGFLLGAYKYIVSKYSSEKIKDDNGFERSNSGDLLTKIEQNILEKETFYGFDIDSTMIRIGLMNLMMHGIKEPKIDYTDTLSKNYNEDEVYDIILANPPFTGSVDKDDINESFELNTTKSELLFLERIYKMLNIGGVAGVIVPQGVLFGRSKVFKQIRQILINRCELKAVISMPSGVFKPYTGVATAILIFKKGGETKDVWFYNLESDGYSLDDKRKELFKKDNKREFGDLHKVKEEFFKLEKNRNRIKQHFLVPKKEIIDNEYDFSFGTYNELEYQERKVDKPLEILEKINTIEKQIFNELEDLRKYFNE